MHWFEDLVPGMQDAGQGKKKSTGRPRSLKRVKLAGTATSTEEKTLPKTTVKGPVS